MKELNNIIEDFANAQSQEMDNAIRELCNTYGFEPENIRDTPYRLVVETENKLNEKGVKQLTSIYLTEIKDVKRIEFTGNIELN